MIEYALPDPNLFTQTASNFSFAGNFGDPIRTPRPGGYSPPTSMHLVYLEFDAAGKLVVRQLFAPQLEPTIDLTSVDLYHKAKSGADVLSTNFENLIWNTPCYITFVIHNVDWKFYWRDGARPHDGIKFLSEKETLVGAPKTYVQNKSFYAARHFRLKDRNHIEHDAITVENHIRDGNGAAIPMGKHVDYCFEIYLEAPFLLPHPSTHLTLILDPDGQNQGPRTL